MKKLIHHLLPGLASRVQDLLTIPLTPWLPGYLASWRRGTSEELFASFVLRIPLQNWTKLHLQLSGLSILHHTLTHVFHQSQKNLPPAIQVSEEEIAHAISSFPNGSSGRPDGLRPQHLKDLISTSVERGGRELLRALTSFVNLVLDGKTPPSARPFFFGATLIPLGKKGGGIRPIAVGHTLHRLVAKCASSVILPSLGNLLAPLQLGCGTPMGCEAMVHAARQFVHNLIPGQMLLKLDFKNAFNCLRRDKMLMTVRESIPKLFRFVHSVYAQTSSLFCTDQVFESSEGVQQGDPLGPMLFCLTIHPMVEKLRSELKVFYLDDGTLGGNLEDIIRDLQLVEKEAAELGLQLNRSKSELLCEDPTTRDQLLKVVPGLQVIGMDQVEILGSPVGSMTSVDVVINEKIRLLELLGERLRLLQAQDTLLLLRHSLAIPKVLHVLRSSPVLHPHSSVTLMIYSGTFSVMSSMCVWSLGLLGCRPHYLCMLVGLGSEALLSWHHLPIWPLLQAAPTWSTRSFPPGYKTLPTLV